MFFPERNCSLERTRIDILHCDDATAAALNSFQLDDASFLYIPALHFFLNGKEETAKEWRRGAHLGEQRRGGEWKVPRGAWGGGIKSMAIFAASHICEY